jgi:hypothetical protein
MTDAPQSKLKNLSKYAAFVHAPAMLMFVATVLEQLDLALEHVSKRDVHNARFGLMLTDNAVELVLHQIAKDKANELKTFASMKPEFGHQVLLDKALGRSFGDKVNFVEKIGQMTNETSQTIATMHGYRNEVYHVGLQHEAILPSLAAFYFDVACRFLGTYKPRGLGWGSGQSLPERAKKYFYGHASFPGGFDNFENGCAALSKASTHTASDTIATLSDQLDQIIYEQNICIDIVARGVYEGQQRTRDKAVRDSQAWPLAFSEDGKAFARKHGFSGNLLQFIEWLAETYPLKFRGDPIPTWQKRAAKLRSQQNPHTVLRHYQSFILQTATLRDALMESAGAAEAEIEAAVDRARGK